MSKKKNETVLVVDDEINILSFISDSLSHSGYKVITASTAEEALRIINSANEKIDLLLTDIVLPGLKGHELAERLLAICPGTRLLFMSAYICPTIASKNSYYRQESFLQKPFTPKTLASKIKKVLATEQRSEAAN